MKIKFGIFTIVAKINSVTLSIEETSISQRCVAWVVFGRNPMPFYAGVAVGRYNDQVKTLRTAECSIYDGKFCYAKR